MKLYLLRHGECVTNAEDRLPLENTPLTEKGLRQAVENASFLKGQGIDALYTSSRKRAIQTAEIIADKTGCNSIIMDNLRDYINFRIEGGETYHDLKKRVVPALNEVLNSGAGKAAVVAHLYVNRVMIAELLGMELKEAIQIDVPNDVIYIVDKPEGNVSHIINGKKADGLMMKHKFAK